MLNTEQGVPDTYAIIDGYRIAIYLEGDGAQSLLAVNGGPGLPSIEMRLSLRPLLEEGFKIITFDQLGTGNSDKPSDSSLWNIERYARELEAVREHLGIVDFHLLGHSWGGWLAIEYAISHHDYLASLILEGTCADIPHFISESRCLCAALGPETLKMMEYHESRGDFEHPEYLAAITLLNYRHVIRMQEWPDIALQQIRDKNETIYRSMQGPNEFFFDGNLKTWNRLNDLQSVSCPVMIMVGEFDHVTVACASQMQTKFPNSRMRVFEGCGHGPRREAPEEYFEVLRKFLKGT